MTARRVDSAAEAAAFINTSRQRGRRAGSGAPGRLPARAGRPRRLGGPPAVRCAADRPVRRVHQAEACTTAAGSSVRPSGSSATAAPTSSTCRPTSAGSAPIVEQLAPRVMATAAAAPDADGYCSLSLHAGATVDELHRGRRRPRPAADRGALAELPPHLRADARAPAPAPPRRDRRDRRDRLRAGRPGRRRARRRSTGPSPSRPSGYIPRRRHPADRHRGDPLAHRHAARRGRPGRATACTPRCSPPG